MARPNLASASDILSSFFCSCIIRSFKFQIGGSRTKTRRVVMVDDAHSLPMTIRKAEFKTSTDFDVQNKIQRIQEQDSSSFFGL